MRWKTRRAPVAPVAATKTGYWWQQFALQSTDANLYYRGVAYMFWQDALRGGWGNFDLQAVIQRKVHIDGSPLARTATGTVCHCHGPVRRIGPLCPELGVPIGNLWK